MGQISLGYVYGGLALCDLRNCLGDACLRRTYGEQPPGTLIALTGSTGWVEVAVVNGDAARQLTAGPGTTVWFRRKRFTTEDTESTEKTEEKLEGQT